MDKAVTEEYTIVDLRTYEIIFNKYYQALVNYAYTILKDNDESEDVVQRVFVSIWEKRESIQVHTSLKALLYKAVYNSCLNVIKQQKVRTNYNKEIQFRSENFTVSETIQQKELQQRIEQAIGSLPEQCAKIFRMSRFDNLKYQEIADKLHLSVKTVENQMGKALKLMREQLKDYLPFILILLNLY